VIGGMPYTRLCKAPLRRSWLIYGLLSGRRTSHGGLLSAGVKPEHEQPSVMQS
jgi:hypothetical protein